MMQKVIYFFLLLSTLSFGQNVFEIKNGSKIYNAKLIVNCESDNCNGKGSVVLTKKNDAVFNQTLTSGDLYFNLDDSQKPSVNIIQLYNEQSPLIFEDFNFDGNEDLAIRNGNNSGYGGPSYDVYVFNITKNKFVISSELTSLAYDNLGMFQTDSKRKRLITFSKSGCCWHLTTEYEIIPNNGLHKVYELEEDATSIEGENVKVTTRKWLNNKWNESIKTYTIKDYYKE